jgi:DNA-binding CsgD family transcriptional regulator
MDYITITEAAEKWGISVRRTQDLCRLGKIPGAQRWGRNWMIPSNASRPIDGRRREAKEEENMPMPRQSPILSMTNLYHTPGGAAKASKALQSNPEAKQLFDAGIAFSQGKMDIVYEFTRDLLKKRSGFYAVVGAGALLAQCAVWWGDIELWNEAKKHISQAPCRNSNDREILALVQSVVDISFFWHVAYPEWFERGNFEILPPDFHPAAKVYYAKLLYATAYGVASGQYTLESVRGLDLMSILPGTIEPLITQAVVDRTVIPEIHLRLWCAVMHHNCGRKQHAIPLVDKAIALALPDRLYGVLAEHWRQLDSLLEERLAHVDPEAVKTVKEMYRTYLSGRTNLGNKLQNQRITANLSSREREVAKLISFGFKNKEVAQRLNISDSTVKTIVQKIMQKTGVTDRTDFVHIL